MKKLTSVASILLAVGTVNAGMELDFDDVSNPKQLPSLVRQVNEVSISDNVLEVKKPEGAISFKTKAESNEFKIRVDWRRTKGVAGPIFRITDFNVNKRFLSIIGDHATVRASSFSGKRDRMRSLFKTKPDMWYRFEVNVEGKRYTLTVTERGTDNSADGEVVYDSLAKKKKLRTNSKVSPNVFFACLWPGDGSGNFSYDNIILND